MFLTTIMVKIILTTSIKFEVFVNFDYLPSHRYRTTNHTIADFGYKKWIHMSFLYDFIDFCLFKEIYCTCRICQFACKVCPCHRTWAFAKYVDESILNQYRAYCWSWCTLFYLVNSAVSNILTWSFLSLLSKCWWSRKIWKIQLYELWIHSHFIILIYNLTWPNMFIWLT